MNYIKLPLEPGFYLYYRSTNALAHCKRFETRESAERLIRKWKWSTMRVVEVL